MFVFQTRASIGKRWLSRGVFQGFPRSTRRLIERVAARVTRSNVRFCIGSDRTCVFRRCDRKYSRRIDFRHFVPSGNDHGRWDDGKKYARTVVDDFLRCFDHARHRAVRFT